MKELFSIDPEYSGGGPLTTTWGQKGALVAVAGKKRRVVLYGKDGKEAHSVELGLETAHGSQGQQGAARCSSVNALKWDSKGTSLLIVPSGADFFFIWDSASPQDPKKLSIGAQIIQSEITTAAWSPDGNLIALGTRKGAVLVYDASTRKVVQNLSIHEKAVTAIAVHSGAVFSAGAERSLSVTSIDDGTSLVSLRGLQTVPRSFAFSNPAATGAGALGQVVVCGSAGVTGRLFDAVAVFNVKLLKEDSYKDDLIKLDMRDHRVVFADWVSEGSLVAVYTDSMVFVTSTSARDPGAVQGSCQIVGTVNAAALCADSAKLAVSTDDMIKLISLGVELTELSGDRVILEPGEHVEGLAWSPRGQILTTATATGAVAAYLGAVPAISAAARAAVAYLSSLSEAAVLNCRVGANEPLLRIKLQTSAAFLGLSGTHLLAGVNNTVWFHRLDADGDDAARPRMRTYPGGAVQRLRVNDTHVALMIDGRVTVHSVLSDTEQMVPYPGPDATTLALTDDFLVIGTSKGHLQHYLVDRSGRGGVEPLNEYLHTKNGLAVGIDSVWAPVNAVHLAFSDTNGKLFLFSPVNDQVNEVPDLAAKPLSVVFDAQNPNVFIVSEARAWHVCVYCPVTMRGPCVKHIRAVEHVRGSSPLALVDGRLVIQLDNGSVSQQPIECLPQCILAGDPVPAEERQRRVRQAISICDLAAAWAEASTLPGTDSNHDVWRDLAALALEVLDVESAIAAFRKAGDASMVFALEPLAVVEEKHMLAGHLLALVERDYDAAQARFLASGDADAALTMRKDLRHWEAALKLAADASPESKRDILVQYACMLEMQGNAAAALQHFSDARSGEGGPALRRGDRDPLAARIEAGIARCLIATGDVRGGLKAALATGDKDTLLECAAQLETINAHMESAELYERGGDLERAAGIYIRAKAFAKAEPLMAQIKSSKLQLSFAKAKEAQGKLNEAAEAYERAGDFDSTVRLLLTKLNNSNKAFALARRTRSKAAAAMVVNYCLDKSNWAGAIEFNIIAGDLAQARQVAQTHNEMDTYAACLGSEATPEIRNQVALYYQNQGDHQKAAAQFESAGNFYNAVSQLMAHAKKHSGGDRDEAMKRALELMRQVPPEEARRMARLIHQNMEQSDHEKWAEQWVELNLALGNRNEAALMAMDLALADQREGRYKVAHGRLVKAIRQLQERSVDVPAPLLASLATLHSYTLVKARVQLEDHLGAARLLLRVSANISRFELHAAQIMTSTVIECQRAGLTQSAFEVASTLMQPEYRDRLKEMTAHKRKIESVVRKPNRTTEASEGLVECCWCGTMGGEYSLACEACQNPVPFCIVTGKRMVLTDWTECPRCSFPARMSDMTMYLSSIDKCPMCAQTVDVAALSTPTDPLAPWRRHGGTGAEGEAAGQA